MAQSGRGGVEQVRLFVACYPPDSVIDHARRWVAGRLPNGVRMTAPVRWHVTVAFLGDVPVTRVPRLRDRLTALPPRDVSPVELAGAASFGRSTVVLDLHGSPEVMTSIARDHRQVVQACAAARCPPDRRRWHPHLTVARAAQGHARVAAQALTDYTGPPWHWSDIRLVESRLGPHPQHTVLAHLAD